MAITVAMIEEKEFKTKVRGYDPVEVDEFLDEICDEMVAMQDEINSLNQRLAQASRGAYSTVPVPGAVPAPAPTPIPAPVAAPVQNQTVQDTSEAAQKLLARAQKMYDETVAEAKAEAEEILKNAHSRADVGLDALEEEKAELEKEVEMLRAAAADYRERFLRLVEDQTHVLKSETKLFE